MKRFGFILLGIGLSTATPQLFAQPVYSGSNVTGQVLLSGTANLLRLSQGTQALSLRATSGGVETKPVMPPKLRPPTFTHLSLQSLATQSSAPTLGISPATSGSGFLGLIHQDERLANNGNQLSIEPPSPGIAVANGYILEGVNNAVMVYSTSGTPLLNKAVSTNEVFGLSPAIIRGDGNFIPDRYGAFPTDMRIFHDQTIDRWFILQRLLDRDVSGNFLNTSHLYFAVSQTSDPTGTYSIYTMNTTNSQHAGCPCLVDYPQIGADQYGFYISSDEYNTFNSQFVDATILGISKASLAAGIVTPTSFQFFLRNGTGYEFAITPAVTPPGASYFLASNGLQYFVSSISTSVGSNIALWAMTNTASLATNSPSLALTQLILPTEGYRFQDPVRQKPGFLQYGSTLFPAGQLAFLDGGDNRIQSAVYSGGRLYVTLDTALNDDNNRTVVGSAYFIISPAFRGGALAAQILRQGYLLVNNNNLLRSVISVNSQGKGVVAFTLVGPDYYPSAAFVPISLSSTGTTVQIAASGVGPEDGFTGYPDQGFQTVGTARWGDYSAAAVDADGSIWTATEFIPNAPRTTFANWGTFLDRYVP